MLLDHCKAWLDLLRSDWTAVTTCRLRWFPRTLNFLVSHMTGLNGNGRSFNADLQSLSSSSTAKTRSGKGQYISLDDAKLLPSFHADRHPGCVQLVAIIQSAMFDFAVLAHYRLAGIQVTAS